MPALPIRIIKRSTALLLTCCLSFSLHAEVDSSEDATAKYLKSLGNYLGYDLTNESTPLLSDAMLDYTLSVVAATATGQNILYAMLKSIPINATFPTFFTGTNYDSFNQQTANKLFEGFASPSENSTSIAATDQFDQQQWQNDPVSQAILNIVGTPDLNTCPTSTDSSTTSSSSACLSNFQSMLTVLNDVLNTDGELPGEYDYQDYTKSTSKFITQLNSNNLLGPMIYATTGGTSKGFPAGSQLQQAQAFIRYATEGVLPTNTMSPTDYSTLRKLAYPSKIDDTIDMQNVNNAKFALASYLLNMRVYAAKSSVAIGNLYYLLGKRMPQTVSGSDSTSNTSEEVDEFHMATWRLYNPETKDSSSQWPQKINTAAPSTIQKEMAILLSEINYQLYLNRQQQERLLLTNSMILIQLLSIAKPSGEFPTIVDKDPTKSQNVDE